MTEERDVFISYARSDSAIAMELAEALDELNLSFWMDVKDIEMFASLRSRIEIGVGHAKSLVAVYSETYPTRPWCMAEFTAAYLAGYQLDHADARVLIVNPEESVDHIVPRMFHDQVFASYSSASHRSVDEIARNILRVISRVDKPLGSVVTRAEPQWFGELRISSPRFVGRIDELWEIHDALMGNTPTLAGSHESRGICQIRGMGGIGKSLLAEEYAWRYASAWPAGVFWLDAGGDRYREANPVPAAYQKTVLHSALGNILLDLGGDPQALSIDEIRSLVGGRVGDEPALDSRRSA